MRFLLRLLTLLILSADLLSHYGSFLRENLARMYSGEQRRPAEPDS